MEELDLLKKDWNKKDHFPEVSEKEIYGMLHKNSSSTVKWIFIISILELSFGIILSLGMSFTKYEVENTLFLKKMGVYSYYEIFTAIMYVVIVYFIVRFYLMYRKVSTTDNTKQLMHNILKTRKTVQNYILFNLVAFAIGFMTLGVYVFEKGLEKGLLENGGNKEQITFTFHLISFGIVFVMAVVFVGLFWLIYNLIYGRLLRKLHKNFNELKKIDL